MEAHSLKQAFQIPWISSHSLPYHYNINYQYWWAQLKDCITRLSQTHGCIFITSVSYWYTQEGGIFERYHHRGWSAVYNFWV